jgi:signal transduction histidine kinase
VLLFQRIDELSTLNSIAQLLAIVTDLPNVLGTVCETIARLFNAAGTLISILDPDDAKLTVRAQFARSAAMPDLLGQVVYLWEPAAELHMTGRQYQPRQDRLLDALHDRLRLLVGHELRLVTLQAGARLTGIIAILIEPPDRALTATEITLAETIAGHVAVAIENARLYERAQATAVDAERQRFGRDLHDSVVQLIYSMTLLSDAWAAAAVQGTLDDVAGRFRQLGSVSLQALREMRLLIHQLRPPVLKDVGLIGALQRRLEMVEQRLGIATRIAAKGDLAKLPHIVEEQLFAIGQEALNNALRHAGAGAVEVGIELTDSYVTLVVHDDGRGFNPAEQPSGMGLITMRERAAAIGGRLEINTALWQGTTVEVSAPAKDDMADADSAPLTHLSIGGSI